MPLMTWLRQQPAGHNYLIAGSGNSQLYAGNGGDLLIGSSAQFENGQFVLGEANGTQDGGRDVMEGGNGTGQDLMIGGVGGDAMLAGTGNSVLIGGTGENILEGGGGSDVLVGGSLINVMMSNDAAANTSYLLGGTGLNFEFAGAGNDQLFDYNNLSDPLQANAWNIAQGLATQYHVALPTSSAGPNTAADTPKPAGRLQRDLGPGRAVESLYSNSGELTAVNRVRHHRGRKQRHYKSLLPATTGRHRFRSKSGRRQWPEHGDHERAG